MKVLKESDVYVSGKVYWRGGVYPDGNESDAGQSVTELTLILQPCAREDAVAVRSERPGRWCDHHTVRRRAGRGAADSLYR